MASASRAFGNSWQTQPRTILSTTRNGTRLGLPRRSTMICCRNTGISASNAARGRNRSTTIPKTILQRSNIPQRIARFCVSRQLDGIGLHLALFDGETTVICIDRRLRNVFQDGLTAELATGFGADNQRVCFDLLHAELLDVVLHVSLVVIVVVGSSSRSPNWFQDY